MHSILGAVASLGGAVGFLAPPDLEEARAWLAAALADASPPGPEATAGLCVVRVDGAARALGCWRRRPEAIFPHRATVTKVMAHPAARGLGLGRVVTAALVDACRLAGMETVTLTVRGNNHLARALYASLGFVEYGVLADVIEVGDLRFDEVHMALKLGRRPGVTCIGSEPVGPGASPAPRPEGRGARSS